MIRLKLIPRIMHLKDGKPYCDQVEAQTETGYPFALFHVDNLWNGDNDEPMYRALEKDLVPVWVELKLTQAPEAKHEKP